MSRPNIVLIMVDQQRMDMLGCYGHPVVKTPNIDALAGRGVRFSQAYCNCLPCSPSRASVFTGRYPHQHGVLYNDGTITEGIPTLASVLGGAGYQLGYAGKWHVDTPKHPSDHGFVSLDCPNYGFPWDASVVDGLAGQVLPDPQSVQHYKDYAAEIGLPKQKILKSQFREGFDKKLLYALHSGGKEASFESMVCNHAERLFDRFSANPESPFFVWANFWGPHRPHIIPEPYFSMYDPELVPEDPAFADDFSGKPAFHKEFAKKSGIVEYTWDQWKKVVATYWGYITMIDDLVGQLIGDLDQRGILDNTIILFTADHGDMMGAHRQFEKGPTPYDETWRVPFIVAAPSCKNPGSVYDGFTYLHDILPTFARVAGAKEPIEPWQRDLSAAIDGEHPSMNRDCVYLQFFRQVIAQEQRIIRTCTHKLVHNVGQLNELYDLVLDPHEMTNEYDSPAYKAVREKMEDTMVLCAENLSDPLCEQLSNRHPS